ncbi:MAG: cellulase family glycosylhydrolase [Treponema sp.]|nr:cellulase family glycosylhydrolase [Treponema sp.]
MKAILRKRTLTAVSIFTALALLFASCKANAGTTSNESTDNTSEESTEENEGDTSDPVISAFTATAGVERVSLSWTVTDNVGVTSVKLYQGSAEGSETTELTEITSTSTTSYQVSGLTNGTTYYFKLVAADEAGNTSEKTANATPAPDTTPPVISAFKAVAGNTSVTLKWTVTDDEGVTSVKLYQGSAEGSETTELTEITSTSTTSYEVSGLTNDTTYYFKLIASDEAENTSEASANATPAEEFTLSSKEFASQLTIGWNLGNTLDAYSHDTSNQYVQGLYSETCWGMPSTTQAMIEAVYAAGFEAIRIPISWHNHITETTNYTIDSDWMARVKTVVDWAYNAGFYVIINVHHDNLSSSDITSWPGYVISLDSTTQSAYETQSKTYLEKIWNQIAEEFNDDYGERLIFEVLNEPRTVGENSEWWANDTNGKTLNDIVTAYEQVCINAIRDSDGKNAKRYIMVPAYKGSSSNINTYTLPTDTANDKLILSFHAYDPYNFAMYNKDYTDTTFDAADKTSLDSLFANVNNYFPGIGAVIGEASASNKDNLSDRVAWATYYFDKAYNDYGWPTVMWDNGAYEANSTSGEQHGWFKRSDQTWYFPTVISAAMNAVGVTPGTLSQASETSE